MTNIIDLAKFKERRDDDAPSLSVALKCYNCSYEWREHKGVDRKRVQTMLNDTFSKDELNIVKEILAGEVDE